jgi:hypothetical protein
VPYLYFVFGRTLDEVLDVANFTMKPWGPEPIKHRYTMHRNSNAAHLSKVEFKLPRKIEFIGSLAEYVNSLPNVDEDWYNEALLKFALPKLIIKE